MINFEYFCIFFIYFVYFHKFCILCKKYAKFCYKNSYFWGTMTLAKTSISCQKLKYAKLHIICKNYPKTSKLMLFLLNSSLKSLKYAKKYAKFIKINKKHLVWYSEYYETPSISQLLKYTKYKKVINSFYIYTKKIYDMQNLYKLLCFAFF